MMYCIVRNVKNIDDSYTKMYYAGLAEQAQLPGWTIAANGDLVYKYKSRNEARAALAELLAKYTNNMLGAYIGEIT